ncbi:hypothetical protein DACRYDRAFT_23492 [Dacryopinax primogenitus]|uniref:Metallo-dependent hydrolase n=1 Tax=Dacryopinax primogenitus (strain DJM 731) TaxID=1858805 RepID=M5G876_DACPD|nr:uncharacterized protein DACRYDRAFT_23492 [Dacryopinax primogenitus]EJT99957.1 hypothetical protein DACRYDRAFT_23492 [Dacryopinax primogenitus]
MWLRRNAFRNLASVVRLGRASNKVAVIDAGGSLVLPGLVQAHMHLSHTYLDSGQVKSPDGTELFSNATLAFVGTLGDTRSFRDVDTLKNVPYRLSKVDASLARIKALVERGRLIIETALSRGVTSMRTQVEVDTNVGHLPFHAGCVLQREFEDRCDIRISLFATQAIYCQPNRSFDQWHTDRMKWLLQRAAGKEGVRAVGSAPFMEDNMGTALLNIQYILDLAETHGVDAEFHLDVDISQDMRTLFEVIQQIQQRPVFNSDFYSPEPSHVRFPLRVTLGHRGRLSSMSSLDKSNLAELVAGWEIYFVGVSYEAEGLFRRSSTSAHAGFKREDGWFNSVSLSRSQSGSLVKDLDAHTSLAIENTGTFTSPWDADPLTLLAMDGANPGDVSETQAQSLLRMVTLNAAAAAGMGRRAHPQSLHIRTGDVANLVILDGCYDCRTAVFNPPLNRITIKRGQMVSGAQVKGWKLN